MHRELEQYTVCDLFNYFIEKYKQKIVSGAVQVEFINVSYFIYFLLRDDTQEINNTR